MIKEEMIDEVLEVLIKNTQNDHVTRKRYLLSEVFKGDRLLCNSVLDEMVYTEYITFINSDLVKLSQVGKDIILNGGHLKLIENKLEQEAAHAKSNREEELRTTERDESQVIREVEKDKREEKNHQVNMKLGRYALWTFILTALFGLLSYRHELLTWIQSLLTK